MEIYKQRVFNMCRRFNLDLRYLQFHLDRFHLHQRFCLNIYSNSKLISLSCQRSKSFPDLFDNIGTWKEVFRSKSSTEAGSCCRRGGSQSSYICNFQRSGDILHFHSPTTFSRSMFYTAHHTRHIVRALPSSLNLSLSLQSSS